MSDKADGKEGHQPLANFDKLIHEPARLLILTNLFVIESADFTYIMRQTGLTWGNLSSHMTKLEDAGYIKVTKTFKGKKPNTMMQLTQKGRKAFKSYRQQMKQVLDGLLD
jgi:DNA-binding MarR family transcriptional regulator